MRGILTLLLVAVAVIVAAPLPARAATDGCALPGATGMPGDDHRKQWWGDEGRPTDWERFVRPRGTVRAVMLFVDFPNARAQDNAAPFDGVDAYHDFLAPAADWLRRSSSGRLDLRITPVRKWLHMPLPDADYGIVRTMPLRTQARYVRDAVALADGVDFSDYDLVYVVPSRNAVNIALSPAYVDPAGAVTHGVTFGRDMWSWGYKILVHETAHTFGLPDLYLEPSEDQHGAVRGWDIMGNIAGHAPDFFAWHKWKLDWLRDDQVDCVTRDGTTRHRLSAVERPGGTKAVVVRTGETTAYVVESRRDAAACSTGALVYKITSPLRSGEGPIRVVDATPGSAETDTCRDLDIATLQPGRALKLPGGVTVELLSRDTVEVTGGRSRWRRPRPASRGWRPSSRSRPTRPTTTITAPTASSATPAAGSERTSTSCSTTSTAATRRTGSTASTRSAPAR